MNKETTIETDRAERLMKALCNHFARKNPAGYEGNKGFAEFDYGKCDIEVVENKMFLKIFAENEENMEHLKFVVEKHLKKFSPDEEIVFDWSD